MIVCALFTIADIIAWGQLTASDEPLVISGLFAVVCWTIVGLAGVGVIGQS